MRVAGTMSGTSLDGVDMAVIATDGVSVTGFGETRYRAYSEVERDVLRAALGRWPGEPGVAEAAEVVEAAHLDVLQGLDVDAVAVHGQTLAHEPGGRGTHQVGDGARLSSALGLPVVWDFRTADVELGGQGAPLASFYHWAAARFVGAEAPVAVLNLGGVGNVTWVDPQAETPDAPGALLAFDTGFANAPMDDVMAARGLGGFDRDGALARNGSVDPLVVQAVMEDPYFYKMPPKSLDRNDFAGVAEVVADMTDADALASLSACVVASVARGMEHMPSAPEALWVTGGGRRNGWLMESLAQAVRLPVCPVEEMGLDGDFLEAQAFGYLAVRVMGGRTTSAPGTTGVAAAVGGGRVSGR
ncbi:MAG: anhydro-N-acetylmuramic acid kinase [Pseudomonadota bacterium]